MTCCSLPTPDSILEDDEIDVFEAIIPDSDNYYQAKRDYLWAMYRYRSIGCGNIPYWIQCMKDRNLLIKTEYDIKITAFGTLYDNVDANGPDFSESSSEYDQENTREDVPDNATGTTEYLSERTKTHYSGKGHAGLETTTAKAYIDDVPRDVITDFCREFERLFYHGL